MNKKYKKIKIPIGDEDIRMFEELVDGHIEPFTWTFDKIDVEFFKDEDDDDEEDEMFKERDRAMERYTSKLKNKLKKLK